MQTGKSRVLGPYRGLLGFLSHQLCKDDWVLGAEQIPNLLALEEVEEGSGLKLLVLAWAIDYELVGTFE